jgi:hypothetical protein
MTEESIDTDSKFSTVLELVSDGMAVSRACKVTGLGRTTLYRMINSSNEREREFSRALQDRGEKFGDELIDLVDEAPPDGLDAAGLHAWSARQRLRFDARRWIAARLCPKRYGDKLEIASHRIIDIDFAKIREEADRLRLARERHLAIEYAPPNGR